MNPSDDSPFTPSESPSGSDSLSPTGPAAPALEPLGGDPLLSVTPYSPAAAPSSPQYPEDLQITWSWPHFFGFLGFTLIIFLTEQSVLLFLYAPRQKMTTEQLKHYLMSKPQVVIGGLIATIVTYALLLFFLYISLALRRGQPFWSTLGWRKIKPNRELPRNPFVYFIAGSGLSLFVAFVSARTKQPENIPMEQLFKHRETALLFVAMAVLVAPLVEETLFRGYLYPLFAHLISAFLRLFGIEDASALRSGVFGSIIFTGALFGLMHGAQLGWTWSLVSMLILVGIIFTLVRARTGSVFASFLMHLGYNSLIAVASVLSTHGFTRVPIGQ